MHYSENLLKLNILFLSYIIESEFIIVISLLGSSVPIVNIFVLSMTIQIHVYRLFCFFPV